MYIKKEFALWAKRFPDEFYKLIFKLNKWSYDPKSRKRPGIIGKYTNNIVYSHLAPGILKKLQSINPPVGKNKRRKSKHDQWLTDDISHPKLQEHMSAVLALMRAATTWKQFERMLNRALPEEGRELVV